MANWCGNSIAFYQEDGGSDMVQAFYADISRYQDFVEADGSHSDWVGNWLQSNRIDTDEIYCRGFINSCELYDAYIRIDIETAWSPLPEVWDKMAEKYRLKYVYIAEECGCEIYINTDTSGRYFTTRYMINCFDVTDLELGAKTEAKYGERLREIGCESRY